MAHKPGVVDRSRTRLAHVRGDAAAAAGMQAANRPPRGMVWRRAYCAQSVMAYCYGMADLRCSRQSINSTT